MKSRKLALSYHDNIYLGQKQIRDISLLKDSDAWPTWVYVLDESFDINEPEWGLTNKNGRPASIYAWAEYHFRGKHNARIEDLCHALRIWWGTFNKVQMYLIHQKEWNESKLYLAYNAAWCLLGYEVGQEDETLDLCHRIALDPTFDRLGIALKEQQQNEEEARLAASKPRKTTLLAPLIKRHPTTNLPVPRRRNEDGGTSSASRERSFDQHDRSKTVVIKRTTTGLVVKGRTTPQNPVPKTVQPLPKLRR